MSEQLIYVELPKPDNVRLIELVNNPPLSVLASDAKSVLWLDEVKREINKLKITL